LLLLFRRTEDDRDRDLLPPPSFADPDSRPRAGREVVAVTFRAIMAESPRSVSSSLRMAIISFAVLNRFWLFKHFRHVHSGE
jgi:hypothetical protein